MDLKQEAARTAVSSIQHDNVIGLGCGSAVRFMVDFLAAEMKKGLQLQVVTSSFTTHQYLQQNGILAQPVINFETIDSYFDGCDQFDKDLNALKSGGGIHTREKLLASMAREFSLVVDDVKYAEQLSTKFPLVIEVLPHAFRYVSAALMKIFPETKVNIRMSDKNDGPAITASGNYLLDTWFAEWPPLDLLNSSTKAITGVVETSLFYKLVHKAIIGTADGVKILEGPIDH